MGLFTDFYNKVAKFFRPQDENNNDPSKAVATNRLKLVLMQDRTNLTPKILEQMRGEMVDLLSKYLEMDKDLLELNFEQDGDQVALMLSIPVIRAKDEEEIDKAIKESLAKQAQASENDIEEDIEGDVSGETKTESETTENISDNAETIESETQEIDNETETNDIEIDESTDSEQKPKGKRGKKVSEPEDLSGDEPPSPFGDEVSEIKQS